jgi:hypothetical protein
MIYLVLLPPQCPYPFPNAHAPNIVFSFPIFSHLCPTYQNARNVAQGFSSSASKRHIDVSSAIFGRNETNLCPRLNLFSDAAQAVSAAD